MIIRCEQCENLHLVADNLSTFFYSSIEWFEDEKVNIEELMKRGGDTVRKMVTNQEVMEFMDEANKLNEGN